MVSTGRVKTLLRSSFKLCLPIGCFVPFLEILWMSLCFPLLLFLTFSSCDLTSSFSIWGTSSLTQSHLLAHFCIPRWSEGMDLDKQKIFLNPSTLDPSLMVQSIPRPFCFKTFSHWIVHLCPPASASKDAEMTWMFHHAWLHILILFFRNRVKTLLMILSFFGFCIHTHTGILSILRA